VASSAYVALPSSPSHVDTAEHDSEMAMFALALPVKDHEGFVENMFTIVQF
jgi:hypothetical protein